MLKLRRNWGPLVCSCWAEDSRISSVLKGMFSGRGNMWAGIEWVWDPTMSFMGSHGHGNIWECMKKIVRMLWDGNKNPIKFNKIVIY